MWPQAVPQQRRCVLKQIHPSLFKINAPLQGLQREDLVVKFGHLTSQSFTSSSLQILAELVAVSENVRAPRTPYQTCILTEHRVLQRELPIKVIRLDQTVSIKLTPRKGWGGRGMLG